MVLRGAQQDVRPGLRRRRDDGRRLRADVSEIPLQLARSQRLQIRRIFARDYRRAAEVDQPVFAADRRHGRQAEAQRGHTARCTIKKAIAHFVLLAFLDACGEGTHGAASLGKAA